MIEPLACGVCTDSRQLVIELLGVKTHTSGVRSASRRREKQGVSPRLWAYRTTSHSTSALSSRTNYSDRMFYLCTIQYSSVDIDNRDLNQDRNWEGLWEELSCHMPVMKALQKELFMVSTELYGVTALLLTSSFHYIRDLLVFFSWLEFVHVTCYVCMQ